MIHIWILWIHRHCLIRSDLNQPQKTVTRHTSMINIGRYDWILLGMILTLMSFSNGSMVYDMNFHEFLWDNHGSIYMALPQSSSQILEMTQILGWKIHEFVEIGYQGRQLNIAMVFWCPICMFWQTWWLSVAVLNYHRISTWIHDLTSHWWLQSAHKLQQKWLGF